MTHCGATLPISGRPPMRQVSKRLSSLPSRWGISKCSAADRIATIRRTKPFLKRLLQLSALSTRRSSMRASCCRLDDPGLPDTWDMLDPHPTLSKSTNVTPMLRIDALNHALAGMPEDRVRYHICWGSWHGPHTTDIALTRHRRRDAQRQGAGLIRVEAGNVRHEHEY